MKHLPNALSANHILLQHFIKPGQTVIDATMGNGHDTLLLAQLVGPSGVVHAFDIQQEAVFNTHKRLESAYCLQQCHLHHMGHEHLSTILGDTVHIHAATFNLGYLPNADKTITTLPQTTLQALQAILKRLAPNGIVTLVVYHGHDNGKLERDAVLDYLSQLDQKEFTVMQYGAINQLNSPPFLIAIEKRVVNNKNEKP